MIRPSVVSWPPPGAALVLMHMRGTSREMYRDASYDDVAAEVRDELAASLAAAGRAGVSRESMIVDPGLGFAKRAEHSCEALARLADLAVLDRPILVGSSRKSFLTRAIGDVAPSGPGLGHGRDRRRRDPRRARTSCGCTRSADGPGGAGCRRNRERDGAGRDVCRTSSSPCCATSAGGTSSTS